MGLYICLKDGCGLSLRGRLRGAWGEQLFTRAGGHACWLAHTHGTSMWSRPPREPPHSSLEEDGLPAWGPDRTPRGPRRPGAAGMRAASTRKPQPHARAQQLFPSDQLGHLHFFTYMGEIPPAKGKTGERKYPHQIRWAPRFIPQMYKELLQIHGNILKLGKG